MPDPSAPTESQTSRNMTVHFTGMAYGGDAVGKDPESGLTVFAWPGIEGESAQVVVTAERKNLLRGLVTEVLEPASLRVAPPCPYFGPCGGCQWQHIEYKGQVGFKHDILRSQLSRIGGIADPDTILQPPIASPRNFGYRNTSHFAIDSTTRSVSYFTRDSHAVVAVERCPISNQGINAAIPIVNSILAASPSEDFVREQTRGVMRVWQVTIRASEATGHIVAIFHSRRERPMPRDRRAARGHDPARPDSGPSLEPDPAATLDLPLLRKEVRRTISGMKGEAISLTALELMEDGTTNLLGATRAAATLAADVAADTVTGSLLTATKRLSEGAEAGPPLGSWVERLGGRYYWVGPEAFFQVNTPAAELLLAEVAAHLPEKLDLLLDAHAGVGTFALAFAGRANRVICFETGAAAIHSGRWSATSSGIENVEFRHGRAETLLPRLAASEQPDLVLLDPPRSGCHPGLLAELLRRRVPRILYVSCDPSTLARDLKTLSSGYSLTSARVVDMFPQTFHLETVAVLGSH